MVKYAPIGVRGSVVERVPDKNEVHGSIPCAPTHKKFSPLIYCVHYVHNVHMANTNKIEKVAFTAFRNDLAFYLEKLAKGEEIQIINARRNRLIVSLVKSGGKWVKKT